MSPQSVNFWPPMCSLSLFHPSMLDVSYTFLFFSSHSPLFKLFAFSSTLPSDHCQSFSHADLFSLFLIYNSHFCQIFQPFCLLVFLLFTVFFIYENLVAFLLHFSPLQRLHQQSLFFLSSIYSFVFQWQSMRTAGNKLQTQEKRDKGRRKTRTNSFPLLSVKKWLWSFSPPGLIED